MQDSSTASETPRPREVTIKRDFSYVNIWVWRGDSWACEHAIKCGSIPAARAYAARLEANPIEDGELIELWLARCVGQVAP